MFSYLTTLLAWFYSWCHSYGGAIILLTLAIMLLLTPLTLKGTRSMLALQQLQPELKKLQNRYKDDREKLNQEVMKFYKENNINPLGGCLPLLVQMPVLWVLYRVLIGLTERQPYFHDFGVATAKAITDPTAVFHGFGTFNPAYLSHDTLMYQDLSHSRTMQFLGMDLAKSASQVFGSGIVTALPYLVLVALVAATSYYQQKQVSARGTGTAQMNQQQQMLLKVMPLFFAFISLTLPAGVVVYFFVSNLWRVGQQALITRTMYAEGGPGKVIEAKATDTTSTEKSGGLLSALLPSRESLPDVSGARRGTKTAPGGKTAQQAKSSGAKGAKGTPSKGGQPSKAGPQKGGGSQSARRKTPGGTKKQARPAGKGGGGSDAAPSGGGKGPGGSSNGKGGSGATAPSRQAPQAPARSSSAKKKKRS